MPTHLPAPRFSPRPARVRSAVSTPARPAPTLPGTATQLAVLHAMAIAASTEEGAAAFGVGVLETVFGLAYSAEVRVRLQATQLLLKLASAARAGVGAAFTSGVQSAATAAARSTAAASGDLRCGNWRCNSRVERPCFFYLRSFRKR